MEQLSGQDAQFLHLELDGLPQHIGGVYLYDQSSAEGGKVRFKQILGMLESRLHESPVFRRKLQFVPLNLGRPYWIEDPSFDLEYHVRHIALPSPGDWRQLTILAARLHAQPLPRDKPLWEMYVIEGLNNVEGLPPNCFAVLLKVHHCAMDGATAMQFMNIIHDLQPAVRDPGKAPPWIVERISAPHMLSKAYLDTLKKPGDLLQLASHAVPALRRIRKGKKREKFHELGDRQVTRFQGRVKRHRVVDATKFDFGEIRAIKSSVPGATINDTMLTIVAGAMRKYLDDKGETPEHQLVAGCPIDVRAPEERSSGGNMVGFMRVGLRTDITDPAERLAAIVKESRSAKAYAAALGPRIMIDIADVMPGNVLSLAARVSTLAGLTGTNPTMNTLVTNVPGPPHQLYLCGATQIDSLSLLPLTPGCGIVHTVLSSVQNKQGTITLCYTACRQQLPDPQFYTDCIRATFAELKTKTSGKNMKPSRKKK